jgi:hypothetical protein
MVETRKKIEQRLSVLHGADLSGVHHAAAMLTLGCGPLAEVRNFRGRVKRVGKWALHVQCDWRIERAGAAIATRADLCGSDEDAQGTADRLYDALVRPAPVSVEHLSADEAGGLVLALSREYRLIVMPDDAGDSEDWRFFATGVDAAHLVMAGGAIAPESFD